MYLYEYEDYWKFIFVIIISPISACEIKLTNRDCTHALITILFNFTVLLLSHYKDIKQCGTSPWLPIRQNRMM